MFINHENILIWGKNVIARQTGDDYQAKFFWLKACGLYHSHTRVKKVAWEANNTFGFDDVVVYYDPAVKESDSDVIEDCYQVKFHVDHDKGFTWESLMDSEFIGNKTESILQRLYKNYQNDPSSFPYKRFNIVNTWTIDHSNDLKNLLGNNGGIRIEVLAKGGATSKYGKIREAWKKHLNIDSDETLMLVLSSLRIKHSYDDLGRLKDKLNMYLSSSGFEPIPEDQLSSKYNDLIQKLHGMGQNIFTREELLEICKQERLYIGIKEVEENFFKAGVRSFYKGAENLHNEVNDISCLLHCFSGRFILDEYSGMEFINTEIGRIADKIILAKSPVLLHLDTHLSIAMLLGKRLNPKFGGLDITIVQKTFKGNLMWRPQLEKREEYLPPFWDIETNQIDKNGNDIVLSISVTHDVREEVSDFVKKNLTGINSEIQATIKTGIGGNSIKDATHAVLALEELIASVRSLKRKHTINGRLHIFMAAPVAMAFFLGQRISPLGSATLYEYDYEQQRSKGYHAILDL
ncbi:MAG: SAVED domain-containing protein [Chryseobacterium sp.]|uniref:SAVED domain-containing protein n=1 Tax=Chryseobacterium sp. TaxID=1871047 RepID=UPI0025B9F1D7|nr:SAVED domain-containing protein [Chryseobacterium sp.]MCJ7933428.1 SAVED domain-containing protein [Chryseobacterium sp.]